MHPDVAEEVQDAEVFVGHLMEPPLRCATTGCHLRRCEDKTHRFVPGITSLVYRAVPVVRLFGSTISSVPVGHQILTTLNYMIHSFTTRRPVACLHEDSKLKMTSPGVCF